MEKSWIYCLESKEVIYYSSLNLSRRFFVLFFNLFIFSTVYATCFFLRVKPFLYGMLLLFLNKLKCFFSLFVFLFNEAAFALDFNNCCSLNSLATSAASSNASISSSVNSLDPTEFVLFS